MTFRYTVRNEKDEILESGWVRDEDITSLYTFCKKFYPSNWIEIILSE